MHRSSNPPGPKMSRMLGWAEPPKFEAGCTGNSSASCISCPFAAFRCDLGVNSPSSGAYTRSDTVLAAGSMGATESAADLGVRFAKTHPSIGNGHKLRRDNGYGWSFNDSTLARWQTPRHRAHHR